uniref:Transmembrane protein 135 N-terminal domain-containing protein n=1 Tax=Bombyx mori TaxID=7091 RepID=A0A8R2MB48_BOMMO|nr:uncharacterized protein LOC119631184 [Bombyx mori]
MTITYFDFRFQYRVIICHCNSQVFEYWVRTLEMKGWLRRSPRKETLIFMLGSAVFFYLMRRDRESGKQTPLFWFFTPPRVSKETGQPVGGVEGRSPACPHRGPCLNYILKGTLKLFGVGCAMTMLRAVIPKILTPMKALKSLRLAHLRLGIFFGGYIGIYRLVVCALCRAYGRDSASYALPAGLLAGAAFRAAPSTPIALARSRPPCKSWRRGRISARCYRRTCRWSRYCIACVRGCCSTLASCTRTPAPGTSST